MYPNPGIPLIGVYPGQVKRRVVAWGSADFRGEVQSYNGPATVRSVKCKIDGKSCPPGPDFAWETAPKQAGKVSGAETGPATFSVRFGADSTATSGPDEPLFKPIFHLGEFAGAGPL
jgi:hypothetical protein